MVIFFTAKVLKHDRETIFVTKVHKLKNQSKKKQFKKDLT